LGKARSRRRVASRRRQVGPAQAGRLAQGRAEVAAEELARHVRQLARRRDDQRLRRALRQAEKLVESGLDDLGISIDGPPEVHDRVRGRARTFEQLSSGLERLNAAKRRLGRDRPRVRFSFTITDANYNHILEFIQAVEPLEPAEIMISHLNFISDRMAEVHNAQYDGDLSVVRSNLGDIQPEEMPVATLWEELQRVKAYVRDRSADPARRQGRARTSSSGCQALRGPMPPRGPSSAPPARRAGPRDTSPAARRG